MDDYLEVENVDPVINLVQKDFEGNEKKNEIDLVFYKVEKIQVQDFGIKDVDNSKVDCILQLYGMDTGLLDDNIHNVIDEKMGTSYKVDYSLVCSVNYKSSFN